MFRRYTIRSRIDSRLISNVIILESVLGKISPYDLSYLLSIDTFSSVH